MDTLECPDNNLVRNQKGTPKGGDVLATPKQKVIFSPSIEFIGHTPFAGVEDRTDVTVLSGLHFWWPKSGLAMRVGIGLPVTGNKESGYSLLFQVNNHVNWKRFLSRPPEDNHPSRKS